MNDYYGCQALVVKKIRADVNGARRSYLSPAGTPIFEHPTGQISM